MCADRYWVGGAGCRLNNMRHLSSIPDGPPGASLPTSEDDLYITDIDLVSLLKCTYQCDDCEFLEDKPKHINNYI